MADDFKLTMDELRAVAQFALDSAQPLLRIYESESPTDQRPRAALAAAQAFADGAPRTNLQRVAALDAHRAAKEATGEVAQLAARACGDAAAAAYLHPIAKATQVGHILRAAVCAARVAELNAGGEHAAALRSIEAARDRSNPLLANILCRYPAAPSGPSHFAQLMSALDTALRATCATPGRPHSQVAGPT